MAISAPFNRATIENALYAWLSTATGVTVIWANQSVPQPTRPYATLALMGAMALGHDELVIDGAPSAPQAGLEVALRTRGHRRLVLSVNVYGTSNSPASDARAIMDKALAALAVPSFLKAINAAGIGVARIGNAVSLDFLIDDKWTSRVQADVTLCVAANVEERTGYIAQVEANDDLTDSEVTFSVVEE